MDRRNFLTSFSSAMKPKKEEVLIVRPPYNSDDSLFEKCKECEDPPCVKACEENIIKLLDNKTPYLDFRDSGCTYCDECFETCPNEVLNDKTQKIKLKIEIDISKCMSWHSVMCFSCKDPCLDNAIDFLALFRPSINDNCTNCGFCVGVCPSNAISLKSLNNSN